jgi:hypothetical protein
MLWLIKRMYPNRGEVRGKRVRKVVDGMVCSGEGERGDDDCPCGVIVRGVTVCSICTVLCHCPDILSRSRSMSVSESVSPAVRRPWKTYARGRTRLIVSPWLLHLAERLVDVLVQPPGPGLEVGIGEQAINRLAGLPLGPAPSQQACPHRIPEIQSTALTRS